MGIYETAEIVVKTLMQSIEDANPGRKIRFHDFIESGELAEVKNILEHFEAVKTNIQDKENSERPPADSLKYFIIRRITETWSYKYHLEAVTNAALIEKLVEDGGIAVDGKHMSELDGLAKKEVHAANAKIEALINDMTPKIKKEFDKIYAGSKTFEGVFIKACSIDEDPDVLNSDIGIPEYLTPIGKKLGRPSDVIELGYAFLSIHGLYDVQDDREVWRVPQLIDSVRATIGFANKYSKLMNRAPSWVSTDELNAERQIRGFVKNQEKQIKLQRKFGVVTLDIEPWIKRGLDRYSTPWEKLGKD